MNSSKLNIDTKCEMLANKIMFSESSLQSLDAILNELGLEYRKGKTIQDVYKAIKKARNPKMSYYKSELECSSLAMYLKLDVFKNSHR